MPLIIDGYNLLHASGIFGRPGRSGQLAGAREALLDFLAGALAEDQRDRTTIVFDADRRRGPTHGTRYRGITVLFASEHDSADALIEELIARCDVPRRLVVVSSDHRLHRAARRRKAQPVDSDRWFRQLVDDARRRGPSSAPESGKPATPLPPEEIDYWTRIFSTEDASSVRENARRAPKGREGPKRRRGSR